MNNFDTLRHAARLDKRKRTVWVYIFQRQVFILL